MCAYQRAAGVRGRHSRRSVSVPIDRSMPTHKDSPWLHDERAARDRAGVDTGGRIPGGRVPPSREVRSAAGSGSRGGGGGPVWSQGVIERRRRDSGLFLRSPVARGFAWGVFLTLAVE